MRTPRSRWREWREHPFMPPDFCRIQLLFSMLVAVELIVVVIWLAPRRGESWTLPQFAAASTMALWFGLVSAVLLCKSRPLLARLPALPGALLAWVLPVSVVWLGSLLVQQVDLVLGLGPALLGEGGSEYFAGRNAAIAAVFCAALLRYLYVQEQGLRNERAQARAAVHALQARIRPHFLFNSMNTIASLVRRDPAMAERAVEDLSDLFRAALGAGEGLSTLEEEVSLARRYLDIEKLRLAERLRFQLNIGPGVPMDLPLPRLCLQPLVENAIQHGIAKLADGGCIELDVQADAGTVSLELSNPVPTSAPVPSAGNRHAVANIEQRLAYHFGEGAHLHSDIESGRYVCRLSVPRNGVRNH